MAHRPGSPIHATDSFRSLSSERPFMESTTPPVKENRALVWVGRVISALPVLLLLMSATMKFLKPPEVVEGFAKMGYSEDLAIGLGIVELAATILYVVPQTAVFG